MSVVMLAAGRERPRMRLTCAAEGEYDGRVRDWVVVNEPHQLGDRIDELLKAWYTRGTR